MNSHNILQRKDAWNSPKSLPLFHAGRRIGQELTYLVDSQVNLFLLELRFWGRWWGCPSVQSMWEKRTDGWWLELLGKAELSHSKPVPQWRFSYSKACSALTLMVNSEFLKSKQGSLLSILPTCCTPITAALQEADTQPPAASQGRTEGKYHFSSISSAWTSAGCSTLPHLPQDSISEGPWDGEGAPEESRQVCAWLWGWFLGNVGPPAWQVW